MGSLIFMEDRWLHSPKLNLFTDAIGFGPHWCYGKWPTNWEHLNIAILEFYPIVLSLYLWGAAMSNQCILFFTDNESLVHIINKQSCKDKTLMVFVRQLVSICLNHNIVFKAKHIPGIHNNLADALSCLQVQTFRQLALVHMDPFPTEIPLHLVGMLAKCSLQPSSIPTYRRAIFHSVVTELPISPHTLALFIAYMYDNNYAPSTVSSYVSALGYSHRLLSFPDPTKAFFIIQMLKGYTKLGSHLDSRLPITLPILHRIIESASQLAISQLHCCQFQAMCAIAFYGFLRISEITSNSLKNADIPLQVHQLLWAFALSHFYSRSM